MHDNILYKVLLVGDAGVGKSSLLASSLGQPFSIQIASTIGVDLKNQNHLQIWDTAGQERFRAVTKQYFRGAHGAILVFDLTKLNTFNNLDYWLQELNSHCHPLPELFLVGNKADCKEAIAITTAQITQFVQMNGVKAYFQVSATSQTQAKELFQQVERHFTGGSSDSELPPLPPLPVLKKKAEIQLALTSIDDRRGERANGNGCC